MRGKGMKRGEGGGLDEYIRRGDERGYGGRGDFEVAASHCRLAA